MSPAPKRRAPSRPKPPVRRTSSTRTRKPAAKKKAQRRFTVQNPVKFRSPVVRNKRRSKRKAVGVGSVVFTILTVTAYVVVGVSAAVITGLVTGVATGVAVSRAARSEPSTPRAGQPGSPRPTRGRTPSTPKTAPAGSVLCGANLRGGGTCSRPTTPGQNCGIPSHPAPPEAAA